MVYESSFLVGTYKKSITVSFLGATVYTAIKKEEELDGKEIYEDQLLV